MKKSEFAKNFPNIVNEIDEEINPQGIFEEYYFNKHNNDYRTAAYNACVQQNMPCTSTFNSISVYFKNVIKVFCPKCQTQMKSIYSGGSGDSMAYHMGCDCGTKVSITVPTNGISITFKEV